MLRSSSIPLSPPERTTSTLFSLGSLARASRNSSTYRIVSWGSWWKFINMNTLHQFFNHYAGFPFLPGSNTKSPFLHISASKAMPSLTIKNSLLHRSQHVPSSPQTLIVSSPLGLRHAPMGIEPFVPSPLICGMPFLNIWGLHKWLMV